MPSVVVAALSARPLAQSARRAAWDVIALDLFGDLDTRAASRRWTAIGDPAVMRIDGDRLRAALHAARADGDCTGWIAGAGFEAQPELLEAGAEVLPLFGNHHAVTRAVRDARGFFAALTRLGIAFPDTVFAPPAQGPGWLRKDFGSSGGWQVERVSDLTLPRPRARNGEEAERGVFSVNQALPAAPTPPPSREAQESANRGVHYQREAPGTPMSLLFLADGRKLVPIAINVQRVRAHGARPFVYHGAIGPIADTRPAVASTLVRAAYALVQEFRLRGLNSLDVMVDGDVVLALELNARPTATLALHDAQAAHGLLHAHVEACQGRLPDTAQDLAPTSRPRPLRGESIVFARRRSVITDAHARRLVALGCHDVPQPQTDVPGGAPLCTVGAQGTRVQQVEQLLAAREAAVQALVQNRNEVPHHVP